jgi:hypothetical protein
MQHQHCGTVHGFVKRFVLNTYIDEVTKSVNDKRLMKQNVNELRVAAIVFINSRAKHLLAAKSLGIQGGNFIH